MGAQRSERDDVDWKDPSVTEADGSVEAGTGGRIKMSQPVAAGGKTWRLGWCRRRLLRRQLGQGITAYISARCQERSKHGQR
jgi:hypothetical protein